MHMAQGVLAICPGFRHSLHAIKLREGEGLEQAEEGLGVAVRSGAQEGQKPDNGRRPPVGELAETLIRGRSLQREACEHGINFLSLSKWLNYD